MKTNQHFDFHRFGLLLRVELYRSRKAVGLTLIIAVGLLFFMSLLLDVLLNPGLILFTHEASYAASMIIAGFILSSMAFSELGSTLSRTRFLSLPVSALERFSCMWLLTAIGWVGVYTVVFTLYTLLANPVGRILFPEVTFVPFQPLGSFALTAMSYYLAAQGIFLMGSAYFRSYALPKTLATLIATAMVLALLVFVVLKDVFLTEHDCNGLECSLIAEIGMHWFWTALKAFFWWILAPLTWVLTYWGLKNQEV